MFSFQHIRGSASNQIQVMEASQMGTPTRVHDTSFQRISMQSLDNISEQPRLRVENVSRKMFVSSFSPLIRYSSSLNVQW